MPNDAIPADVGSSGSVNPLGDPVGIQGNLGEPGPQPQATPSVYEVKVDGQIMQVPLDELRNGYQRQADYTRKTQALSAREKELEGLIAFANQLEQRPDVVEYLEKTLLTPQGQPQPQAVAGEAQDPIQQVRAEYQSEIQQLRQEMTMQREAEREIARFEVKHPEVNVDDVLDFCTQRGIPSVEDGYNLMEYTKTLQAQQQQQTASAARVESEGLSQAGAPATQTFQPRSEAEAWKIIEQQMEG